MMRFDRTAYDPTRLAGRLAAALRAAAAARGLVTLAVPGGRSPTAVITALAEMLADDEPTRRVLHLLWVDERAVARDHEDRNDASILAAWEAGGPPPGHVHPMPGEREDLAAAATEYSSTLGSLGRSIDVCLLGLGEDGHIASLFPDHPVLDEAGDVAVVTDSPKPPPRRLTLTLPALNAAGKRIVLVLGAQKGKAAGRALGGADRCCPVSLLRPKDTTLVFDDVAADAAGLVVDS